MQGQKRQFPYHTSVPEVELKRQSVQAAYERAQPTTFEAPTIAADLVDVRFQRLPGRPTAFICERAYIQQVHAYAQAGPTDFTTWTEPQIKVGHAGWTGAFL